MASGEQRTSYLYETHHQSDWLGTRSQVLSAVDATGAPGRPDHAALPLSPSAPPFCAVVDSLRVGSTGAVNSATQQLRAFHEGELAATSGICASFGPGYPIELPPYEEQVAIAEQIEQRLDVKTGAKATAAKQTLLPFCSWLVCFTVAGPWNAAGLIGATKIAAAWPSLTNHCCTAAPAASTHLWT